MRKGSILLANAMNEHKKHKRRSKRSQRKFERTLKNVVIGVDEFKSSLLYLTSRLRSVLREWTAMSDVERPTIQKTFHPWYKIARRVSHNYCLQPYCQGTAIHEKKLILYSMPQKCSHFPWAHLNARPSIVEERKQINITVDLR